MGKTPRKTPGKTPQGKTPRKSKENFIIVSKKIMKKNYYTFAHLKCAKV